MRDAFGGTFLIKLFLIFLVIYITFIAVALNYAKAFKVKNKVIDIIEQNEGYTYNAQEEIKNYLLNVGYYISDVTVANDENSECKEQGYCITTITESGRGTYYKVYTFIHIEFPFFGLDFTIPIRGETKIVTNAVIE